MKTKGRNVKGILIKPKDCEGFNSLSEKELKNLTDYGKFILASGEIFYKAKVTIYFDDGTVDVIYTMDPDYYRNLYFVDEVEEGN